MSKGTKILSSLVLLTLSACAYRPPANVASDPSLSLGLPPAFDTDPAFRLALRAPPGSQALRQARIEYLLEQILRSPYNFIRNGGRYNGKRAKAHFLWKYSLNRGRVITAEDFIDWVATRSKMSGQSYSVEFPDGKRQPLSPILFRELTVFDQELRRRRDA